MVILGSDIISVSNVNDETILSIKRIFNYIQNYQYEEAFFLSSKIIERKDNGDQLFHEWVKALAEFFSCNNKETAIQLLERIKPDKLENEIHFRIINSLMSFYIEIGNESNFLKYEEVLSSNLYKLDNSDELLARIFGNFSNGYYELKNYKKSLEYCEKAINIAQKYRFFNLNFSIIIMIKIMNLFYLGEIEKAQNLKKDFESFLKLTNHLSDIEYLDKAIVKFYKEVENSEKTIKETL